MVSSNERIDHAAEARRPEDVAALVAELDIIWSESQQDTTIIRDAGIMQDIVERLRPLAADLWHPVSPRTVTTVEELDALPPGSIVRWKSGIAGQRDEFDRFKSTNGNLQPIRHCGMFLPATVLYVPSEGVES